MATDIALTDLTNSTIISNGVSDGTGVFDKLMNSVNLYLTDQEDSGKIKGTDYANVLLGSIQAVLQQSIQFTLQEKLTEAQIDKALVEVEIAKAQSDKEYAIMLATIDKELGFGYTLDVEDNLVRSSLTDTGDGKLDYEIKLAIASVKESYIDRVIKDKQATKLGLDKVTLTVNTTPEDVYTPKYEEV